MFILRAVSLETSIASLGIRGGISSLRWAAAIARLNQAMDLALSEDRARISQDPPSWRRSIIVTADASVSVAMTKSLMPFWYFRLGVVTLMPSV